MRLGMIAGMVAWLATAAVAADNKPTDPPPPSHQKPKPKVNPTPERLVGMWELTHDNGVPSGNFKVLRTFHDDGTQTILSNATNPGINRGKYRIVGDDVLTELDTDNESAKFSKFTITKLTGDILEIRGPREDGGQTAVFRRVKPKR